MLAGEKVNSCAAEEAPRNTGISRRAKLETIYNAFPCGDVVILVQNPHHTGILLVLLLLYQKEFNGDSQIPQRGNTHMNSGVCLVQCDIYICKNVKVISLTISDEWSAFTHLHIIHVFRVAKYSTHSNNINIFIVEELPAVITVRDHQ